ncbi:MAG: hypothetical protein ACE5I1_09790, partial [bacterium]
RKRQSEFDGGFSFAEGTFLPIAFSVWDGFNKERGNKRGMSSWYYLYLEPMQKASAVLPMLKWGFITIMFELVLIGWVRARNKSSQSS